MDVFIDTQLAHYYERSPLTLVDIGARGGLQSHWRAAQKHLRVVGFEPDPDEYAQLTTAGSGDGSVKYLNAALHEQKAKVDFHIARSEGASSLFQPDREFLDRFPESERFDIMRTIELQTDTLDNQLLENGITDVDFIKVDTQGSELSILRGAQEILGKSILGLEIEVEFAQIYRGQPLFADVDNFVRAQGFTLFDLKSHYWKRNSGKRLGDPKGQIIFADALYFRTLPSLKAIAGMIEAGPDRQAKVLKALSVCILYGYLDYALEIFDDNQAFFAEREARIILDNLEKAIVFTTKVPDFAGKGRIAGLFYSIYKLLYPTYKGWATSDKAIGNTK